MTTVKTIKIIRFVLTTGQKNSNMKKGTVKFFNEAKGFGFIKAEDGEEIFVHSTGLNEDIRENDNVSFDTEDGRKGLNAVNVSLV
jgi:CspA family cold shock protein